MGVVPVDQATSRDLGLMMAGVTLENKQETN
jgi:hypothetical protein